MWYWSYWSSWPSNRFNIIDLPANFWVYYIRTQIYFIYSFYFHNWFSSKLVWINGTYCTVIPKWLIDYEIEVIQVKLLIDFILRECSETSIYWHIFVDHLFFRWFFHYLFPKQDNYFAFQISTYVSGMGSSCWKFYVNCLFTSCRIRNFDYQDTNWSLEWLEEFMLIFELLACLVYF